MKSFTPFLALTLLAAPLHAQSSVTREQTADQQVLHVLNRAAFGPRPGDAQKLRAMGVDAWIEQQLHPERIDDSSFEQFLNGYKSFDVKQSDMVKQYAELQRERRQMKKDSGEDTANLRRTGQQLRSVVGELQSSRVARAVSSERQLQEVMTDFWENHFNVYARKGGPMPFLLTSFDRDVIRPNSLGKFRDLLGAVAKSPAMLFYLDNARSTVDSTHQSLGLQQRARKNPRAQRPQQLRNAGLNENYARELLELHTLGVDGGYTQNDVIEVARALTGWTMVAGTLQPNAQRRLGMADAEPGSFVFRPEMHDADDKVVLGKKLKGGRGLEDGEDVLNIVARYPATARYIATKLARRFISDNPPQSIIDRATQTFTKTDGDIREVVRTILTSPEFFAQASYRAKVKSPFEVVASAARALGAAPDASPRTALVVAYLGQPIFGHQAPNGYPETGDAWMNTGAILNRINFGLYAASPRFAPSSTDAFGGQQILSATRDKQVDAVAGALFGGAISPDTRKILVTGDNPMLGSADAKMSAAGIASAADGAGEEMTMAAEPPPKAGQQKRKAGQNGVMMQAPKLTGFAQIVGLAIGSPEFQRR
ncbi:MAG: DUF1800 domain-containing protein [Gemmatimonadaceae bacterium]|nr:DUF1800 domain-containing protein [Gemmatimonadaceae bacterium]